MPRPRPSPAGLPHGFTVIRRLGRGATAEVWLARVPGRAEPVALKRLRPAAGSDAADPAQRRQFRREYDTLRRLDHPAIVKALDYHDAPCPFYTLEHARGKPPRPAPGGMRGGDLARLWKLGEKLFDALAYLHERGLVHRDLKPGNLRVTPAARLKLLDFGLIREKPGQLDAQADDAAGTAHYISPEQIRGEGCDGRSDLYSAGVILYELAAGRRPFAARNLGALLHAHLEKPPTDPRRFNAEISAAHAAFLLRLLEKKPGARPADAYAAAASLRECVRLRARAARAVEPRPAPYVGNAPVRSALRAACGRLARGTGGMIFITGEAGAGKSRLLPEVEGWIAPRDIRLLRGTAREAGGMALQLFQEAFADDAAPRAPGRDAVLALHVPALRARLPMNAVLPAPLEPARERDRLFAMVDEFFSAALRRGPLLLWLEDLHWADPLSLELVARLQRLSRRAPLLLIATLRGNRTVPAGETAAWLRQRGREGGRTLALRPLMKSEAGRLAAVLLGKPASARTLSRLMALTAGNPFLISESLRGGSELPVSVAAILNRQIEPLVPADRAALQAAALLGGEFHWRWWRAAAELPEPRLRELAGRAQRLGLLVENRERWNVRHDLLRRALLAPLRAGRRRTAHLRIYRALAGLPQFAQQHPELLLAHAAGAGLAAEAGALGHAAAVRLWSLSQYPQAQDILDRLRRFQPRFSDRQRLEQLRLTALLGSAQSNDRVTFSAGRRAIPLARRLRERAIEQELWRLLGGAYRRRSDYARGAAASRACLRIARTRGDRGGMALAVIGLAVSESQTGRLAAARRHAREAYGLATRAGDLRASTNALNIMGYAAAAAGDLRSAVQAIRRAATRVRRHDPADIAGLASYRGNLGDGLLDLGRLREAAREVRFVRPLNRAMNRRDNLLVNDANLGRIAVLQGRFAQGIALLRRSVALAVRLGFPLNEGFMRQYLAEGLLAAGRRAAARAEAARALSALRHLGTPGSVTQIRARCALILLRAGDTETALRLARGVLHVSPRWYGMHARAVAQAVAAAARPSARGAAARISRAIRLAHRSGALEYELWCRILLARTHATNGRAGPARRAANPAARIARIAGMRVIEREAAAAVSL